MEFSAFSWWSFFLGMFLLWFVPGFIVGFVSLYYT